MNKKGLIIASSLLSLGAVAIAVTAGLKLKDFGAFATQPEPNATYTITEWEMIDKSPLFDYPGSSADEFCAGFFFSPKEGYGRQDLVLGILAESLSQGIIVDEELTYGVSGNCVSYRSYRDFVYNEQVNNIIYDTGTYNLCFEVDRMTCVIGTKNSYFKEGVYEFVQPDNFSLSSISFKSWFAYTFTDMPGQVWEEFTVMKTFDNEKVRTFTPGNLYDSDVTHPQDMGPYIKCVGLQVDMSTISLTYGCAY